MAQRSLLYKNHDSMVSDKANSNQFSSDKKTDKIDEINKIKQLAELKQAGIITEEEFITKKKDLLAKI